MSSLWRYDGAMMKHELLVTEIASTPEYHCDESLVRDFQVGAALAIVLAAVRVAAEAESAQEIACQVEELHDAVQAFADQMAEAAGRGTFSPVPTELLFAVLQISKTVDDGTAVATAKRSAEQASALVQPALEPIARLYGWPADRFSEVRGVVVEELETVEQVETVEIDWDE
jgi:hypothetical protein